MTFLHYRLFLTTMQAAEGLKLMLKIMLGFMNAKTGMWKAPVSLKHTQKMPVEGAVTVLVGQGLYCSNNMKTLH